MFVNEPGRFISEPGRFISEPGRFISENKEPVIMQSDWSIHIVYIITMVKVTENWTVSWIERVIEAVFSELLVSSTSLTFSKSS